MVFLFQIFFVISVFIVYRIAHSIYADFVNRRSLLRKLCWSCWKILSDYSLLHMLLSILYKEKVSIYFTRIRSVLISEGLFPKREQYLTLRKIVPTSPMRAYRLVASKPFPTFTDYNLTSFSIGLFNQSRINSNGECTYVKVKECEYLKRSDFLKTLTEISNRPKRIASLICFLLWSLRPHKAEI